MSPLGDPLSADTGRPGLSRRTQLRKLPEDDEHGKNRAYNACSRAWQDSRRDRARADIELAAEQTAHLEPRRLPLKRSRNLATFGPITIRQ